MINSAFDVDVVLTKGKDKADFLKPFLPDKKIEEIDMGAALCKQRPYNHNCEIHKLNFKRCALHHIYQYFMYLEKNNRLE